MEILPLETAQSQTENTQDGERAGEVMSEKRMRELEHGEKNYLN